MSSDTRRFPIAQIGSTLVARFDDDLRDSEAIHFLGELNRSLERSGARGIVLDLSGVETIDSFLGRVIADVATTSRLLGAHAVIAAMHPPVAITLVELGLDLEGVRAALSVARGAELLQKLFAEEDRRARRKLD
jgi:rsbT antagonist protein RsbS